MSGRPPVLIAVLGATASGKSALALALAERYGGEIISCDSAAVYRRFDIGTDKVPTAERRGIPHHLIDVAEPSDDYTAARFGRAAAAVARGVAARGRQPILAGGTGFYFRALTRGLFPGPGRDAALRVEAQFRRGLVDEARALLASGIPATARPFGSLGYRQVLQHLRGERGESETRELIVRETRQYARRQLIWFRKEPNLDSIPGPGELPSAIAAACRVIDRRIGTLEAGAGGEETA